MQTKMDVYITVVPTINNSEIQERLQQYDVKTTSSGNEVRVYARIDIREDAIEKILQTCQEYGDCFVDAHLVPEGS